MSKKTKIWMIVLAVPVGLVIAGAIVLKLYFTSDRLKALIIPRVEEATSRTVTIGDISLSLFPTLGVSCESLSVSAPKEMQFDKEDFFSAEELLLDVNLFALLGNRVEIDEVVLTRPRLYLEVSTGGKANYSQPEEKHIPAAGPPAGGQKPAPSEERTRTSTGVLLSNFRIIDGEVEYIDKQVGRRILLADYDQNMRASVKEGGGEVFLESESSIGALSYGSTKGFLFSNLPVRTYQRLTYNQADDVLSLDSVSVGVREIALIMRGTVRNTQTRPAFDLRLHSTKVELAQLLSLVPSEYMKSAQGLSSSGTFEFAMSVEGAVGEKEQPGVKGTFSITNGSIQYASLPKAITKINAAGSFEQPPTLGGKKAPGRFGVDLFTATLGSNSLTGKLGVVDFENPSISAILNGEADLGRVKEYYPLDAGTELAGALKANFSVAGRLKTPLSMKADGKLEFRDVTMKSAGSQKPLRNLTGLVEFNNQVIETKQLSMNVGESDMALAFTMKNYIGLVSEEAASAGRPAMLATLTSKQLRTMDLASEKSDGASVGTADGAAGGKATKGTRAHEQGGLLPDMDVDANVSIGKLITEKFEFDNARGSVKIREGVITLQNFSVNAFQGNIVTKGTLDVRRPERRPFNFDLEISGVEANALLPKFTSFGKNLFGKLSMNTSLTGDLNDTLGLNTQTLNGDGSVQIFDGKYVGSPMTTKLAGYTGIGELREMNFKNWSNSFTISDGRINIKDLNIVAGNTDFLVNGSQGFDGSLDYRMRVKLPESMSGRLKIGGLGGEAINFLKDNDGRVNLNFKVTGTASDPVYALDTEEARERAKQALEQKAREETERLKEEARKKVEEELKKKAEEGLKKLFKRP